MMDNSSPLLLLAPALSFSFYVLLRLATRKTYEPYPFIGFLPQHLWTNRSENMAWSMEMTRAAGWKTWKTYIPGAMTGWYICDPTCLKEILVNRQSDFVKATRFKDCYKPLLGTGFLLSSGNHWRRQREAGRVFQKPSTLAYIANITLPRFLPLFFEPLDRVANESYKVIDFEKLAFDFTLAHFGHIAFDADGVELARVLTQPYDNAFNGVFKRIINPFYPLLELIMPYGWRLKADIDFVQKFSLEFTRDAIERIRSEELGEKKVEDEKTLGRDTTAHTITWTLYNLLKNPNQLLSVMEEIKAIPPSILNTDILPYLPYLDAAISETLRLYPPVPLDILYNVSKDPILLPDGTIVKPKEQVIYSAWITGRSPQVWGSDEEDLERFRAERWLDMKSVPRAYEWPVFNAGPRNCIGQQMARKEVLIVMKELLNRYSFSMGWDGGERFATKGLTLPVEGGLPVRVSRR